jgi:hypothetical protein
MMLAIACSESELALVAPTAPARAPERFSTLEELAAGMASAVQTGHARPVRT